MDIKTVLGQVELFQCFDEQTLQAIASGCRLVSLADGQEFIVQGSAGDSVWVIAEGEAEVVIEKSGKKVSVATLAAGELLGEMSVMTGEVARAGVRAKGTSCRAVKVPGDVFVKHVKGNIKSMSKITRTMVKRYSNLTGNK